MSDETIAPALYRTGRGDRSIPLGLGAGALLVLPALGWASGPFLWPWGLGAMAIAALVAVLAFRRWWNARITVLWIEEEEKLIFRRGPKRRSVALDDLVSVSVVPSLVRTELRTAGGRYRLSHRLVQVERLLDRLRALRPGLFPVQGEVHTFRVSSVGPATMVLLAAGVAAAGALLYPWHHWVGLGFVLGALLVVNRVLWTVPRSFSVAPGTLTVRYPLGKRVWKGPTAFREDAYSAGGAVFFRMRIVYGNRRVDLDEGVLTTPLRPWAEWVVHQLTAPPVR